MSQAHRLLIPGRGTFSYRDVPNLAAWIDMYPGRSSISVATDGTGGTPADFGLTGRITDFSGNGHYLAASADAARPDYFSNAWGLGHPALFLGGTGERLVSNTLPPLFSGTNTSSTVFIALMQMARVTTGGCLFGMTTNGAATISSNASIYLQARNTETSPDLRFSRRTDALSVSTLTSAVGECFGGRGGWNIYRTRVNGASTRTAYQNGQTTASSLTSATAMGALTFTTSDWFALNCVWNGTTALLNGGSYFFGKLLVYTRSLSDAECLAVERQMAFELGWYEWRPELTPVRTWSCGNSHMESLSTGPAPGSTNNVGSFMRRLYKKAPYKYCALMHNSALSGDRMTNGGTNDIAGRYDQFKANITAGDNFIIEGGSNDVAADTDPTDPGTNAEAEALVDKQIFGESGGQATNFASIVADAHDTRNARVILVTSPPRANLNSFRDHGLNYMATRQLASADVDHSYDWWTVLRIGAGQVAITGITSSAGVSYTITSAAHGLSAGMTVTIADVVGTGNMASDLNATDLTIASVTTDTFTINDATASGTYTSGGTWQCNELNQASYEMSELDDEVHLNGTAHDLPATAIANILKAI